MAPPPSSDTAALGSRIIRGMIVIVFFGLFLKVGGLLMQIVVVSYYGKGQVYDVFTGVYNVIVYLFFFSSTLKVLLPVFMPLFADVMHHDGEQRAWEFANTVLNLLVIAVLCTSAVVFAFAPQIIATALPGFSPEARTRAAELLRWMVPGLAVMLLAVKAQGVLNSFKVFSYPSAGEATQKLLWVAAIFVIIAVLGFSRDASLAPRVIGAGFVIGCLAQAGVLFVGLWKRARPYRPSLAAMRLPRLAKEVGWVALALGVFVGWLFLIRSWGRLPEGSALRLDANDRKFIALTGAMVIGCAYSVWLWRRGRRGKSIMARCASLAGPLVIGIIFARYRDLTGAFFQSYAAEGQFGVIEFAKKVTQLPTVLVAYSLSIAMFPYLCDLAARKDTENLGRIVGRTLKTFALFLLPLTAMTIVLAGPVMQLLADRGTWSPDDVRTAGWALGTLATGIFFMSIENVLMQTFFSLQRTVLPTVLGIFFSLAYSVGLYVTVKRLGYDSPEQVFLVVCIAYPAPRALKNICLAAILHRRVRLVSWREALVFGGQLVVVCAAVALGTRAAYHTVSQAMPLPAVNGKWLCAAFEMAKCLHVALPSLVGLVIFLLLCAVLRIEEFRVIVTWVRRRGWKKRAEPRQGGPASEGPSE